MSAPIQPVAPSPSLPWHTRSFLIAFYLLGILYGSALAFTTNQKRLEFLFSISTGLMMGIWALYDAKMRRHAIPLLARPWFILLPGFVVPVYVICSRGLRGFKYVLLHAIGWFTAICVAFVLTGWALHGSDWFQQQANAD